MLIYTAVTTCHRPNGVTYLPQTLESLEKAWFENPAIFVDGMLDCSRFGYPAECSEVRLGIVPTFRRAVWELCKYRYGRLIVFQDDILVARKLRRWLESNPPPRGVSMLYTNPERDGPDGWNPVDLSSGNWMNLGACAVSMDHDTALMFLDSPPPVRTDRLGFCLAEFCHRESITMHTHSPSLVQHVGIVSVRGEMPVRQAGRFCDDVQRLGRPVELA